MSGISDLVTRISGGRGEPDDNKLELIENLKQKRRELTFDCEFSSIEKREQDPQRKRKLRVWYFEPDSVGSKESDKRVWFEAEGPSDSHLRRQALKQWEKVIKPTPKTAATTTASTSKKTTTTSKQSTKATTTKPRTTSTSTSTSTHARIRPNDDQK